MILTIIRYISRLLHSSESSPSASLFICGVNYALTGSIAIVWYLVPILTIQIVEVQLNPVGRQPIELSSWIHYHGLLFSS